jgi:hypothetical protein
VQFLVDGTAIGGPVNVTGGVASLTVSQLTFGAHVISAVYRSDAPFLFANSDTLADPFLQEVLNRTETIIANDPPTTELGQTVVFTATVTDPANAGIPQGDVTFVIDPSTPQAQTSSAAVDPTTGRAIFILSNFGVGDHIVLATYSGDSQFYAVSSATLTHTVAEPRTELTITANDAAAGESTGPANPGQLTVTRTGGTAAALTVNYTVGGTAASGTDYLTLPGSVVIGPGQSSAVIDVNVVNDGFAEGDESVVLTITAGAYTIASPASATVTIADNQPPTITLPGAQTACEGVDLAVAGIAVADSDGGNLTANLQVSHGTVTLRSVPGVIVTGDGSAAVTLTGSQVAINAALTSLVYSPFHNYNGPDTLIVTASDGLAITTASVAIHVKSLNEQAAELQAQVKALQDAGVLNNGQANSLLVKLELQDNRGDIGRVQSFLKQVGAFVKAGILSPEEAKPLSEAGNILLTDLKRR